MADMTPLSDILNDDAATATPVQNNFQTIEAYINGTDLVRTDGTEVMAADLDLDGNTLANISTLAMNSTKITGLADGTADGDAVNYGQLTQANSPLPLGIVGNLTMPAGPVVVSAGGTEVVVSAQSVSFVTGRLYRITYTSRAVSAAPAGFTNSQILIDAVAFGNPKWDYHPGNNGSITLVALYEPPSTAARTVGVNVSAVTGAMSVFTDAPSLCIVEDIGLA